MSGRNRRTARPTIVPVALAMIALAWSGQARAQEADAPTADAPPSGESEASRPIEAVPTDAVGTESASSPEAEGVADVSDTAASTSAEAAEPAPGLPAYIDFNAYYDTRDFGTLTINSFAILPRGFSYFGFVDYTTAANSRTRAESQAFFTEQNIQWGRWVTFPLELHLQWQMGGSVGFDITDVVRVGVRMHPRPTGAVGRAFDRAHLFTTLTYFPLIARVSRIRAREPSDLTPDSFMSQISFFYRFEPFADQIDRRIYLQGFGDFDFRTGDGLTDVIAENQIGVRIAGAFYAVAEVRYANFMPQKLGAGFGLEYRIDLQTPLH